LKDYGRLLKDGELKVRAHSDNRTKTRFDMHGSEVGVEYWCDRADERALAIPRGNQETLLVKDTVGVSE